jgi:hypothetical protein
MHFSRGRVQRGWWSVTSGHASGADGMQVFPSETRPEVAFHRPSSPGKVHDTL